MDDATFNAALEGARAGERERLAAMLEEEAKEWWKHKWTQVALRGLAKRLRADAPTPPHGKD